MTVTLGQHLQDMRIDAGFTVIQAADASEVWHNCIRRFEANEKKPALNTLSKLLDAYGYEMEFMKTHADDDHDTPESC